MTVTAGARPSKRQVVGSAQASARGEDGPLPVSAGGTGATTEPEARAALGVPGLDDDNRLTGSNAFEGMTELAGVDVLGQATFSGGITDNSDDPALLNAGATVTSPLTLDGGNVLTDAPSDGKYYVRKDGAWVEIIP